MTLEEQMRAAQQQAQPAQPDYAQMLARALQRQNGDPGMWASPQPGLQNVDPKMLVNPQLANPQPDFGHLRNVDPRMLVNTLPDFGQLRNVDPRMWTKP